MESILFVTSDKSRTPNGARPIALSLYLLRRRPQRISARQTALRRSRGGGAIYRSRRRNDLHFDLSDLDTVAGAGTRFLASPASLASWSVPCVPSTSWLPKANGRDRSRRCGRERQNRRRREFCDCWL